MLNFIAIIAAAASLMSGVQEPGAWRQVDAGADFYTALDLTSISGPTTARRARGVGVSAELDGFPGYMILDVVFDCVAGTISADRAAFFALDGTLIEEVEGPAETAPVSEEDGTLPTPSAMGKCHRVPASGRPRPMPNPSGHPPAPETAVRTIGPRASLVSSPSLMGSGTAERWRGSWPRAPASRSPPSRRLRRRATSPTSSGRRQVMRWLR